MKGKGFNNEAELEKMNIEMNVKKIGDEEVKKLQEISKATPEATTIFQEWAKRERRRYFINIRQFLYRLNHEGKVKDKAAFFKTFKDLEQTGFGKIKKNKMFLTSNLISIGKAAIEGQKESEELMPKKIKRVIRRQVGRPRKMEVSKLYVYFLRPEVKLEIPDNITQDEASKLINFIQSLT